MQISSIESLQTMLPSNTNTQKRKKVGQWKGSTNNNIAKGFEQYVLAKNYTAAEFNKLKEDGSRTNTWVRKGMYDEVIRSARTKFNLHDDVTISKMTILSHLKLNHKILVAHPGSLSPMRNIELLLLDILLQLSNMNFPATCREGW